MPTHPYILCPGQGAQAVGMGKDFYDSSPAAKALFDTASGLLGWDLADACFNGPEDRLNQTDVSQPALYVTGVASFRAAQESGRLDPASIAVYAGLSLGEYTALHLAGVFDFAAGLQLVAARGRFMQEAAVASAGGMVALLGADEAAVNEICRTAAGGEVLVAANFNAPGQIVLSGSAAACVRATQAAEAAGFRATPLKVAGAFHSPLMAPAAEKMRAELGKFPFRPPTTPVYSNVTAEPHGEPASIQRLLVEQIVSPVRWEQTLQKLIAAAGKETGAGSFLELAPGRTLAGLAKRINRRLGVEAIAPTPPIPVTPPAAV